MDYERQEMDAIKLASLELQATLLADAWEEELEKYADRQEEIKKPPKRKTPAPASRQPIGRYESSGGPSIGDFRGGYTVGTAKPL